MTIRRSGFGRIEYSYWPEGTPCHGCAVPFTNGQRYCYPLDINARAGNDYPWCRECADSQGWVERR